MWLIFKGLAVLLLSYRHFGKIFGPSLRV